MKKITLGLIKIYQKKGRIILKNLFPDLSRCRFSPSCSEYAYQAVDRYGTIRGLFLGIKRLLRCHPFSAGGFDPVK